MSDPSGTKKASIPDWQRKPPASSPEQPPSPTAQEDKSESSSPTLLEQATRFLEDESIRYASTDQKITFLESKGLKNEDIQKLLGISRNTEATANGDESSSLTAAKSSGSEAETAQPSQTQSTSSPSSSPARSPPSIPARNDAPPIITYPEFLFKSPKPPPLITFQGVLYTLYGAAGLATGIYGLSQYVVTPMLETLSTARHDLAETAHQNLKTLNEKLEQNVSTIPPLPTHSNKASNPQGEDEQESSDSDETDSAASDPTELFHRDIATQTTSDLASTPPTTTVPSNQNPPEDPHKTITSHRRRLNTITSHLTEFLTLENNASTNTAPGSTFHGRLSELQTYLTSLTYSSPSYLNSSLYGVYGGDAGGKSGAGGDKSTGMAKGEEDAISSFKTEIRGVKGALLSARNFPSGGGRVSSAMAR